MAFLFIMPTTASAHLAGQPPFFKVNDEYSLLYPVPTTSLDNFNLPQDIAPGIYLVNRKLHLELDAGRLPVPPEVIQKTKFTWNFGDGQSGEGLINDHIYTKIGSYIVDIYANDGTTPTAQIIEKALLNIVPDKNYQLPVAVIKINGQKSRDPLIDPIAVKFGGTITFDASESKSSSKIVSYFWDFGDQVTNQNSIATHAYVKDLNQVFPVLRITDQNGFIADSYVEIENQTILQQYPNRPNASPTVAKSGIFSKTSNWQPLVAGGVILLFVILVAFWWRRKKSKR